MGRFRSSRGRGRSRGVAPGHLRRGGPGCPSAPLRRPRRGPSSLPPPCGRRVRAARSPPRIRPRGSAWGGGGALPAEAPPAAWRSAASCLSAGAQPCGARVEAAPQAAPPENTSQLAGARRSSGARPAPSGAVAARAHRGHHSARRPQPVRARRGESPGTGTRRAARQRGGRRGGDTGFSGTARGEAGSVRGRRASV